MAVANKISLDKAKQDKLFYFVVNVVVYRESDGRCLLLKRHEREVVHPGKWCVPGGKLEWANLDLAKPHDMHDDVPAFEYIAEALSVREVKEEAGIEIQLPLHYLRSVAFVRPDGIPVVLMVFAVKYAGGEVVPQAGDFTDHAWVNAQEVVGYDCIEGVKEEVERAMSHFGASPTKF